MSKKIITNIFHGIFIMLIQPNKLFLIALPKEPFINIPRFKFNNPIQIKLLIIIKKSFILFYIIILRVNNLSITIHSPIIKRSTIFIFIIFKFKHFMTLTITIFISVLKSSFVFVFNSVLPYAMSFI